MVPSQLRQLAGILLLVSLVASSCVCYEEERQSNLKLLCENKQELNLSRASQIRALAQEFETNPTSCPAHIVKALLDLSQLIEDNKNDVCSLEAVNRIRIYYQTHVTRPQAIEQQQSDDSLELPAAVRTFFLAYGLRVSRACKINMIPTLMFSRNYLKQVGEPKPSEGPLKARLEEYYDLLGGLLQAGGKIDNLIKTPVDYDDLLLSRDIEQLARGDGHSPSTSDKLYVQAKSLHALRVYKAICERRYEPVYKQLIMPVLCLSNMGFNYRGEDLKHELEELEANERIHLYYRVTFFCEAIENVEPVEDLEDADRNQRVESSQIVRVLSADEAKEIQDRNEQALKGHLGDKYKETDELIDAIERFSFEPDYGVQLEDEILGEPDSDLMKLVRSFNSNQSELDRIRSRFMRKFKQAIETSLRGHLKVVFGRFYKSVDHKSAVTSPQDLSNAELMKLLDGHLDETYDTERPVAGWFGKDEVKSTSRRLYFKVARATHENQRPNIAKGLEGKLLSKRFFQALGFILFFVGVAAAITTLG